MWYLSTIVTFSKEKLVRKFNFLFNPMFIQQLPSLDLLLFHKSGPHFRDLLFPQHSGDFLTPKWFLYHSRIRFLDPQSQIFSGRRGTERCSKGILLNYLCLFKLRYLFRLQMDFLNPESLQAHSQIPLLWSYLHLSLLKLYQKLFQLLYLLFEFLEPKFIHLDLNRPISSPSYLLHHSFLLFDFELGTNLLLSIS